MSDVASTVESGEWRDVCRSGQLPRSGGAIDRPAGESTQVGDRAGEARPAANDPTPIRRCTPYGSRPADDRSQRLGFWPRTAERGDGALDEGAVKARARPRRKSRPHRVDGDAAGGYGAYPFPPGREGTASIVCRLNAGWGTERFGFVRFSPGNELPT